MSNPTSLQMLVSQISKQGKSQYVGLQLARSTRLQAHLLGVIEALAEHSGMSANKVVNELLQVGIDQTLSCLDVKTQRKIRSRAGDWIETKKTEFGFVEE